MAVSTDDLYDGFSMVLRAWLNHSSSGSLRSRRDSTTSQDMQ